MIRYLKRLTFSHAKIANSPCFASNRGLFFLSNDKKQCFHPSQGRTSLSMGATPGRGQASVVVSFTLSRQNCL